MTLCFIIRIELSVLEGISLLCFSIVEQFESAILSKFLISSGFILCVVFDG